MDKSYYVVKLGTRYIEDEIKITFHKFNNLKLVKDWREASVFDGYDYAEELAEAVGGTVYLVSEPQPLDTSLNSHEE